MKYLKLLKTRVVVLFILALLAIGALTFIENFAAVGTELWQSSRMTRNMSYDLRGDPAPNPYNPFVSPWNISSWGAWPISRWGISPMARCGPRCDNRLYRSRSKLANTSYLTPQEFKTHSRGLSIGPDKTIKKGYLKGWPAVGHEPAWWINPQLLNMEKRWGWYKL